MCCEPRPVDCGFRRARHTRVHPNQLEHALNFALFIATSPRLYCTITLRQVRKQRQRYGGRSTRFRPTVSSALRSGFGNTCQLRAVLC